jgi:hypothetical protein
MDPSSGTPSSGQATTAGSGDTTAGDTGPAGCGNGLPDPGEACDDGDVDDANGCTRTCEPSGSVRWTHVFGGGSGDQRAGGIAYAPDEDAFYVVGHRRVSTTFDEWLLKLTSSGDMSLDQTLDDPASEVQVFGAAAAPDGTIVYTGSSIGPNGDIFVRRLDADGSIIGSTDHGGAGGGQDLGLDVAIADDGVVLLAGREVASTLQERGLVQAYTVDFASISWSDGVGVAPSTARGAHWSTDIGAFFVVGYEGTPQAGWVRQYAPNGTPGWARTSSSTNNFVFVAVAASAEAVFACGYETPGDVPYRAQVFAFAAKAGDDLWNAQWDGIVGAGAYCSDIAVDAQGDLVTVGGSLFAGNEDPQPVVRKISAVGGDELWSTVVTDPSAPVGWLEAVAVGSDNSIVAVGNAGATANARVPFVVGLAP